MTSVTIQLAPEIERELRTAASRSGKSVEAYLEEMAVRLARNSTARNAAGKATAAPQKPDEQWIAEWRAWVKSHPARSELADDSRESIYEGRGE
jgi:hypothetical protein